MGFKDGTNNLDIGDAAGAARARLGRATRDAPAWMHGGTYMVARRIRMLIETWDRTALGEQEGTIGRHKVSGAPLGGHDEFDAGRLDVAASDGAPSSRRRRARPPRAPDENGGAQLLRRGYSFTDGIDPVTGAARRGPVLHLLPARSARASSCRSSGSSRRTTR